MASVHHSVPTTQLRPKLEAISPRWVKSETFEEVAVYTVRGDKIAREQFFYVGQH